MSNDRRIAQLEGIYNEAYRLSAQGLLSQETTRAIAKEVRERIARLSALPKGQEHEG